MVHYLSVVMAGSNVRGQEQRNKQNYNSAKYIFIPNETIIILESLKQFEEKDKDEANAREKSELLALYKISANFRVLMGQEHNYRKNKIKNRIYTELSVKKHFFFLNFLIPRGTQRRNNTSATVAGDPLQFSPCPAGCLHLYVSTSAPSLLNLNISFANIEIV